MLTKEVFPMDTDILVSKYKFGVEDLEENNPKKHKVKDKNGTVLTPMSQVDIDAMWAGGGVMHVGTILQAPIGSNCIVLYVGGSAYKICV
jgi:hypothetical protein